ncbi:MAG: nitronate monooxygenase [Vicinamibacterales bacterium]
MSVPVRVADFCARYRLRVPILLAPMAGVPAPELSIAVAAAGGAGACGVVSMGPREITDWCVTFRERSSGPFQLNNWIPDPRPARDAVREARVRELLERWGPPIPADAGSTIPPFDAQCEAMIAVKPPIVSSIMGLFPQAIVERLKEAGIAWFATATTVDEARAAEDAGADVVIAQGAEAGGHRGAFDAADAMTRMVGLFALVPSIVDAVRVPVIAAGGIADGRTMAAALTLGASAVQIGTGFLRTPEAAIHPAWADALAHTSPERTVVSRVFSGRPGRSLSTAYVRAAIAPDAPEPAPYPVQRGLTAPMRADGVAHGDVERMQAWAGQNAALAKAMPAAELIERLWADAQALLT